MSDKRYPARMHEILTKPGEPPLKSGEMFALNTDPDDMDYYLTDYGDMFLRYGTANKTVRMANADEVLDAINHGITRRPRLTEEQMRVLEALYEVFDFKWLVKQKDGQVMAYANRPNKADGCYGCWFSGEGENEEDYGWIIKSSSPVCSLVSWSDPAPLDIVQTLRDAGVGVEQ